jgi:hypothetical protein
MSESRGCPQEVLDRRSSPASVSDELHHGGQGPGRLGGHPEPAAHRVTCEPWEGHLVDVDRHERRLDRLDRHRESPGSALGESPEPEVVEILRLPLRTPVGTKLFLGQIGEHF